MGFLDHSTNNIIIDAVLTDEGREALARNDGSFSISLFAFGDDEVDYTTIQKYGRTVGKERIEKNTPVFEAQTNSNLGLRFPLVSVPSRPFLAKLPRFNFDAGSTSSISLDIGTNRSATVNLTLRPAVGETEIPDALRDSEFLVTMPDLFLTVDGSEPQSIDVNNIATYLITATSSTAASSILNFTITSKAITSSQFSVYGKTGNKNQIEAICTARGVNSGKERQFIVTISNTTA